jgi:hypothetical protein
MPTDAESASTPGRRAARAALATLNLPLSAIGERPSRHRPQATGFGTDPVLAQSQHADGETHVELGHSQSIVSERTPTRSQSRPTAACDGRRPLAPYV